MIEFIPVLLGSDINVYGMARSFHEEYNVKSLCVGKHILPVCNNTSILEFVALNENIEDDDVFVETLLSLKKDHENDKLLLVPCGDNYLKLLVKNQDKLKDSYYFNCVSYELFQKIDSKKSFYKLCEEYNLTYPETLICTKDNYEDVKIPFKYPIIVKPSNSVMYWNCTFKNKRKVFKIDDEENLRSVLKAVYSSSYTDDLIIQEFIPGEDNDMRVINCYVNRDSKVKLASFGRVLLEECTPEGIGSYAAIIADYDEKLIKMITEFLEKIGYKGFANFDIKYDVRDNSYKVFELNPRQGRSSFFTTASGNNLARFLVEDVLLNVDKEIVTKGEKVLYAIIPKGIIYKYVHNDDLKKEAKELIKKGKFYNSYMYKNDFSIKRFIAYIKNQVNYYVKYHKYFKIKGKYYE